MTRDTFLGQYLPFLLHRTYQLISADFHQSLDRLGVDLSECRILNLVSDLESGTLQQIADGAALTQPTASRVCARLVSNGLLEREVGAGDRRSRVFWLTPRGKSLSDLLIRDATASVDRVMSTLSGDAEELKATLQRIIAELEGGRAQRGPLSDEAVA